MRFAISECIPWHTDITNTEIYLRLTMERYDEVINVGHYIYERVLGGGSDD